MARIPRGKHKHPNLSNLWEHHREIARRLLLGERQCDIAREMKLSPTWVSIVCTSPVFIRHLDSLRARTELGIKDIRKDIHEGAVEAIGVLRNLLKSDDERVQLSTAKDLLDRDGYVPVKKIETQETHVFLTGSKLQELKEQRARLLSGSRLIEVN